jgi:hypothetical protein
MRGARQQRHIKFRHAVVHAPYKRVPNAKHARRRTSSKPQAIGCIAFDGPAMRNKWTSGSTRHAVITEAYRKPRQAVRACIGAGAALSISQSLVTSRSARPYLAVPVRILHPSTVLHQWRWGGDGTL